MKCTVEIDLDNEAFAGGYAVSELGRILTKLVKDLRTHGLDGCSGQRLRDINGNTVGHFRFYPDPEDEK